MTFREGEGKRKREGEDGLLSILGNGGGVGTESPLFFPGMPEGGFEEGKGRRGGLKTLVIITLTTAAAGRREKWESGILWDGGKRRA